MNYCLGTMADPAYTKFLPLKIAEGIRQAHAKRNPPASDGAKSGPQDSPIAAVDYQTGPYAIRSLRQPDRPGHDAPGLPEPEYVGPSAPVDDELSVISIQTAGGNRSGC